MPDAGVQHKPARSYRSPNRDLQARHTRARVIAAATDQFARQGYTATTMRAIAAQAEVSVPTIELLFGRKSQLLKTSIDVAIAGDDEPIPMLRRAWAARAQAAGSVPDFLQIVGHLLEESQTRSASLMLAAYDAVRSDREISTLVGNLEAGRTGTVGWLVDGITARASLRPDLNRDSAIDVVWLLLDPVVFCRLTRERGWSPGRYRAWLTDALPRLLLASPLA